MAHLLKAVALLALLAPARTNAQRSGATVFAITARALVDVERGTLIDRAIVIVRDDRIAAVGRAGEVAVPAGATRIDLGDAVLLPGLIDAHVHLTLAGNPVANARATLMAGFTTVQDLGALRNGNLDLRDQIAKGEVVGPRVVSAGPWLGISGGICDFQGIGVRGADAFAARVRSDVERGADIIKVCVTGWLRDAVDRPDQYEISDAELTAAITEAHRLKRRVAVHAIGTAGIAAAVRAGADLVVHGGFPDGATVELMRQRRVFMLPTLHSLLPPGSDSAARPLRDRMTAAVRQGLPIALGTDAGVIRHGQNALELVALTRIGLTPAQALRAATLDAATAIGLADQVGSITTGKVADLIAVSGDPLADATAAQRVVFVMHLGRVARPFQPAAARP